MALVDRILECHPADSHMKKLLSSFLVIVAFGFLLHAFGLYPVASVDGTLIFARTWQRTLNAEKRVVNVRAHAAHARLIDFSSPRSAQLLDVIRRSTFTFLIDSVLIKKEGPRVVPDLEQLSIRRLNDELRNSKITEDTAAAVYGLDLAALKETVLMPQARQEILSETLALRQKNFVDWLLNARAHTKVKFFFESFKWDQDGVK